MLVYSGGPGIMWNREVFGANTEENTFSNIKSLTISW